MLVLSGLWMTGQRSGGHSGVKVWFSPVQRPFLNSGLNRGFSSGHLAESRTERSVQVHLGSVPVQKVSEP